MANGCRIDLALNSAVQTTKQEWPGGEGYLVAESSLWGGGSVKIQMASPNGTFVDISGATLNANGIVSFKAPPGQLKVVIATATAVYAYAIK